MEKEWSPVAFDIVEYRDTGTFIIRAADDILYITKLNSPSHHLLTHLSLPHFILNKHPAHHVNIVDSPYISLNYWTIT